MLLGQQLLAQGNVSIQNAWRQTYLQSEAGKVSLGEQGSKSSWIIEKIANSSEVRIKNLDSGAYLNAESSSQFPEIGKIEPGWFSAMWAIEPIAGSEEVRIKNKWRKTYLHTENGGVELGEIQPGWVSARWIIKPSTVKSSLDYNYTLYV